MNMVQSMIDKSSKEENPKTLVKKIHIRTHFHPKSLELLLKRAKKWQPSMAHIIREIHESCRICRQTGDPEVSKKFNLNKIHKNFNNRVYMDITYWGNKLILHMVDFATSYSEAWVISSRKLDTILTSMERIWINKHGDFDELYVDQEFEKPIMQCWCRERNTILVPVPSRRHNKAGQVERKNRVLKDILEKLTHHTERQDTNFNNTVSNAIFISNIMYGNRLLSSFEMVRVFTPSISGSGKFKVPLMLLQAEKELQARRLLARVLKSRPLPRLKDEVKIGDKVLILVPGGTRKRGKWVEDKVSNVRNDGSLECGSGRNKKIIAVEDYRTLPENPIARKFIQQIQNATHDNKEESGDDYDTDDCISEETEESDDEQKVTVQKQSSAGNTIQSDDPSVPAIPTTAVEDEMPVEDDTDDTNNGNSLQLEQDELIDQQSNQPRRSNRIRRKPVEH